MRGELIGVWKETWREIWQPLSDQEGVPEDIFCELYRELSDALMDKPSIEMLADIVDSPAQSRAAFEAVLSESLSGERALVVFFEESHTIIDDVAGGGLSAFYFDLLSGFLDKYSIRYDLRLPCKLCPTLPGIFASLVRDLRFVADQDDHLGAFLSDFEESLRDLRDDSSVGRIKTVIQKQVNLLEALGSIYPGVRAGELGRMCTEINSWPHRAVRGALGSIYGFASDYPGIRHAGNPAGAIRPIDMRDMIAVSIVLAGFTPYLRDAFNPEAVYLGI